ncbi:MAG: hypothetical protein U1F30_02785 [Steroidobacteraceae bacterium]
MTDTDGSVKSVFEPIVIGESLLLLRWGLPPLGVLLALAALLGWWNTRLGALAASTVGLLGLLAVIWAGRLRTREFRFEPTTRRVWVVEHGALETRRTELSYSDVKNVVVRVVDGFHGDADAPLGRLLSLQLHLVTMRGVFPLSRSNLRTVPECEVLEARVWMALGRRPDGSLLERSCRYALAFGDRLQAVWLRRLLEPDLTFAQAEGRVQRDLAEAGTMREGETHGSR